MRSLYAGVALAALGTLLLAYFAFLVISDQFTKSYLDPVFVAADELELEDAIAAWNGGGAKAAAAYLAKLDRLFGPSHYLLNAAGRDVVSGLNRSALLPGPPVSVSRGFIGGAFVVAHKSPDGRFWFVAANPRRQGGPDFSTYYLIPLGVTAMLCWLAALTVIRPIRSLDESMRKFGSGELGARSRVRRRDEIGALARSFNEMANRIERLLTSERRLLQDISHELRSPLARMKVGIKLVRNSKDREAALDQVERDVDRLTHLTAELVEMVRLQGEPRALCFTQVDIGELVQEVTDDCRAETGRDSFRCDVRFNGMIEGDRELLRRAIENVARNALRHSPDEVAVTVTECGNSVTVSIRDHGRGVPEDALDRIFTPFYRVDEARDAASGGLGLGLAIARSSVEAHGGSITAENVQPGLCVKIILPRTRADLGTG